jgi:hypothetical protein
MCQSTTVITETPIQNLIKDFFSLYYNITLKQTDLENWAAALNRYSKETVTQAFRNYIRDNKGFKPVLASIIGYCMEIESEEAEADANLYADALIEACDHISPECSIDFSLNVANNALDRMGGWAYLGQHFSDIQKIRTAFIKNFVECYQSDNLKEITELEGKPTDSPYFPKYFLSEDFTWTPVRNEPHNTNTDNQEEK